MEAEIENNPQTEETEQLFGWSQDFSLEGMEKVIQEIDNLKERVPLSVDKIAEGDPRLLSILDLEANAENIQEILDELKRDLSDNIAYFKENSSQPDPEALRDYFKGLETLLSQTDIQITDNHTRLEDRVRRSNFTMTSSPDPTIGERISNGLASALENVLGGRENVTIAKYAYDYNRDVEDYNQGVREYNSSIGDKSKYKELRKEISYQEARARLFPRERTNFSRRTAQSLRSGILNFTAGASGYLAKKTESDVLLQLSTRLSDSSDRVMAVDPSTFQNLVRGLGEAAPLLIPGVGFVKIAQGVSLAVKLGTPVVTALGVAGIEAGKAYEQAMTDGLSHQNAMKVADEAFIEAGLLEGAFSMASYLPMMKILKASSVVVAPILATQSTVQAEAE